MAWPIVIAANGKGIPVTESASALAVPVEIAANGYGTPVVLVANGGTPIKGGGGAAAAPEAFTAPMWTATAGDGNVLISFLSLPAGGPFTDIELSVDDGATYAYSTGRTTIGDWSWVGATNGVIYPIKVRAVKGAEVGPDSDTKTRMPNDGSITAPAAFTDPMWGIVNLATGGAAQVTVSSLPSDGGTPLTDINYRLNGGSWVSSGTSTTGTFTATGFTDGVLTTVELQAVNFVGGGSDSDDKTVTTSSGATAPAQPGSGDWSIADRHTGNGATITIVTPPSDGGSPLLDIEFEVDGSGVWASLYGTTAGTYRASGNGLAFNTASTVKIRGVNTVGNGTASATKSVTPGSIIKSIQSGTIVLGSGVTTNTATITSVDINKSIPIRQGVSTTAGSAADRYAVLLEFTNATTITASRGGTTTLTATVAFEVIEFWTGINSIQRGTIAIGTGATSNTATISAVGSRAFVMHLGAMTSVTSISSSYGLGALVLTNSTTVTALNNTLAGLTVGYVVIDPTDELVDSVQAISKTDATSATTYTSTITSVDTARSIIFDNGRVAGNVAAASDNYNMTRLLTNGTTVTYTRISAGTNSRTDYVTVVQFAAAVVRSAASDEVAIAASTSGTKTISSVTTSKTLLAHTGQKGVGLNPNQFSVMLTLTNSTTVTGAVGSSSSPTASFGVLEFK